MNPDLDRNLKPGRELDDEQLANLVRSVADDWRMPPQRLDQPTWRDRTRGRTARRRGWPVRVAGAAAAALVATILLAVTAVWLNAPRSDRGTAGQSPSTYSGPTASAAPTSTPLPKLVRNGELPSVTQVMVRAEGHYRVADLATGTLAEGTLGPYSGPTALVPREDGGWLCICGSWRAYGLNGATALSLTLVPLDASGTAGARTEVRQVEGTADPNQPADLQFQLVDASVSVAPDGGTAFFAWTARNGGAGWTAGIDVIDVASGTVASNKDLRVGEPAGAEGGPISRGAPSVKVSPAGDRILLAGFWFVEDPNDPTPPAGTDRWTAPLAGQTIGEVTSLETTAAADCGEFDSGLIDSDRYYLICAAQFGELTVRRIGLDGSAIGDTEVARTEGEFSGGSLVARSGDGLYIWDPVAAVMSRVDLGSGQLTASRAPTAEGSGPLDAVAALGRRFGDWIAPSALAKLLLEPGMVISPDGSRLYALGVGSPGPSGRGSTGVYAFDAASLDLVGHWQPTADFTSVAVSADGQFVYAAAMGGVDAGGASSRSGASVTVFDTSDGSVRLIAGQLGSTDLWFARPTLE
jgi:hypothetical protein